jgi:hypothetical protein
VGDDGHADGQAVSRRYVTEIHLELVAVLVVICVALGLFGWTLRPQSAGFPTVPENSSIFVTDAGVTKVYTSLGRLADNGAQLTLLSFQSSSTSAVTPAPSQHWSVEIDNIGRGHICTPRYYVTGDGGALEKLGKARITHPVLPTVTPGPVPYRTLVTSSGLLYLRVCWPSGGPISLNGSYLSAQFPPENTETFSPIEVTRVLYPNAGDTADFVIQSPSEPSSVQPDSWQWPARVALGNPLHLSAINVSGTQHDSYRAFLSGIVFGIAGGALISLVAELVGPLSRRRERSASPD